MGVRGLAGVTCAKLVDSDDSETVGTVGVKGQLQVMKLPRYAFHLLPSRLPLLRVFLLPALHNELWWDTDTTVPLVMHITAQSAVQDDSTTFLLLVRVTYYRYLLLLMSALFHTTC